MQNILSSLCAVNNFGEFCGKYWWLFVLLAVAVVLLIVSIVLAIKQSRNTSPASQPKQQKGICGLCQRLF